MSFVNRNYTDTHIYFRLLLKYNKLTAAECTLLSLASVTSSAPLYTVCTAVRSCTRMCLRGPWELACQLPFM